MLFYCKIIKEFPLKYFPEFTCCCYPYQVVTDNSADVCWPFQSLLVVVLFYLPMIITFLRKRVWICIELQKVEL